MCGNEGKTLGVCKKCRQPVWVDVWIDLCDRCKSGADPRFIATAVAQAFSDPVEETATALQSLQEVTHVSRNTICWLSQNDQSCKVQTQLFVSSHHPTRAELFGSLSTHTTRLRVEGGSNRSRPPYILNPLRCSSEGIFVVRCLSLRVQCHCE